MKCVLIKCVLIKCVLMKCVLMKCVLIKCVLIKVCSYNKERGVYLKFSQFGIGTFNTGFWAFVVGCPLYQLPL